MIDVSPYIAKLEKLKEYIHLGIDKSGEVVSINYEVLPKLSFDELMKIYDDVGIMVFCPDEDPFYPTQKKLSFTEWLELNPQ